MCEVLDIDFINLLKITGFVDEKNLLKKGLKIMNKYKVNAKKVKQIELEVEAENEENATEIVQDFLDNIDISDLKIPNVTAEYFEIDVEEEGEEQEDDLDEIFEENECENCEFFCSECGRCILEH